MQSVRATSSIPHAKSLETMSIIELIPVNKGNRIRIDLPMTLILGRTVEIGCLDNRISRAHAQLQVKDDGTVWLRAIHSNPTFYRSNDRKIVRLTTQKEYQLHNDDQFGLLPDEYFFRLHIDQTASTSLKPMITTNESIQVEAASTADRAVQSESPSMPITTEPKTRSSSNTRFILFY
jgi:hypothetical protein